MIIFTIVKISSTIYDVNCYTCNQNKKCRSRVGVVLDTQD